MNGSWDRDSAQPDDTVNLSGSYDAHDASVTLQVQIFNASDMGGSAPNDGASAVDTVTVTESADLASFTASWQAKAPASGSDGFVFFMSLSDSSQSGVSSKLAVAAAAPPAQDPPAQDPPAQDPPAQDPPADDPPAQDPPAQDPPADDPPAQDPPADDPPAQDPPAQDPPAQDPPADDPPAQDPPAADPPADAAPVVQGISPASADPAGGSQAVITGTGFTGATGVSIGGVDVDASSFSVDSDTQITATVPAQAAGGSSDPVDVVVTGPAGSSDPSAGGQGIFSYAAAAASGAPPQNLQWQDGSGTAITSANANDSVTISFDLAHDDDNTVSVAVLASDQTTQVDTPAVTERNDQTGFTAAWMVPSDGDGFYFQVTVSNPNVSPAADPVTSDELTVGEEPPPDDKAYYYPPSEQPVFDYIVVVTPKPPADSGLVHFRQGSETGTIVDTKDDLVTQGKGRLTVDLSARQASSDSPLFLEFVFSKEGHEDKGAGRAIALADPAPAEISIDPATAKPGDQVTLQVTSWNAVVYDTPGTGTTQEESDTSRISSDDTSAVKWRVGGADVSDQGQQITYTIPDDATADLEVEAFLERSSDYPAKASVQVQIAAAATFRVTLLDEVGAPVDGIDLVFSQSGQTQTVTTDASGVATYTPSDASSTDAVTVNFADLGALRQKMNPLWDPPRTQTVPDPLPDGATKVVLASDTTQVDDTTVDATAGATIYVTPAAAASLGIFSMQCFDGDGANPLAGQAYTITSESDASQQWTGTLDDQGTVRIEGIPHGDYDIALAGIDADPVPILVLDTDDTDPQIRFFGAQTPIPADDSGGGAAAHHAAEKPTITPNRGSCDGGTIVTIEGPGLANATSVEFGGVVMPKFRVTAEGSIWGEAPAHLPPEKVHVVVKFANGSPDVPVDDDFTYQIWYTTDPKSGPMGGGTYFTISETSDKPENVLPLSEVAEVWIGDAKLVNLSHTLDGTITGSTPPHATAEAVDVALWDKGAATSSTTDTQRTVLMIQAFTYEVGAIVTGVSPLSGPIAGGTLLTLTGQHLDKVTGVLCGGGNLTDLEKAPDGTWIKGKTAPNAIAQQVGLMLQLDGNAALTPTQQYSYVGTPVFDSIEPPQGGIAGLIPITILGKNLGSVTSVEIGGVALTDLKIAADGKSLTGKNGAHDAGAVDVVFKGPAGDVTAAGKFSYTTVSGFGVKSLSVPPTFAPGPGVDPIDIAYELSDPGKAITGAKLELSRDSDNAVIWSQDLTDLGDGQHAFKQWDGKINSGQADFPDDYLTVEFSPYTLKLTVTGNGTPSPAQATAKVQVVVGGIDVALASDALTNQLDKDVCAQLPALPASDNVKVRLDANNFITKLDLSELNGNMLYDRHLSRWTADGPRIPLVATVKVKKSDGSTAVSGKALGNARVLWHYEMGDFTGSDASSLSEKATNYLEKVETYQAKTKPKGRNAHARFGGKRGGGSAVLAKPDAGIDGSKFPFTVTAGSKRAWDAFSTIVKAAGDSEGKAGVVFRPSPLGGDTYKVSAYLETARQKLDVDQDPPSDPSLPKVDVARFDVWKLANLTNWVRKNEQVNYPLPKIQGFYSPSSILIQNDATSANSMNKADYDAAFQAALGDAAFTKLDFADAFTKYALPPGVSHWNQPTLPNTWGDTPTANMQIPAPGANDPPTSWVATVYGYGDFKKNYSAGTGQKGAALQTALNRLGCGSQSDYVDATAGITLDLGAALARAGSYITGRGISVIQFLHLTSLVAFKRNVAPGSVFAGVAIPQPADNANADKVGFLLAENGDDLMAHEIGHCFGLVHAPGHAPGGKDGGGADQKRHDAKDTHCVMSYNDGRQSFCGLCVVRLRGYDGNKLSSAGV